MSWLRQEIAAFLEDRQSEASQARQMAALQIACHFDLAEAMKAEPATRARIALRLERMIERERQRGARKHWSYDLNRHIALKQALDSLRPAQPGAGCSDWSVIRAERAAKRKAAPAGAASN
jgi:hypothetical protein